MLRLLKFLGLYVALTFAASFGMLVFAFPHYPKTLVGWAAFFLLALPITLVGEAVEERLWRNRVAQAIERRTEGQSFSWLRIAYGFLIMLALFAVVWGLALFFNIEGNP